MLLLDHYEETRHFYTMVSKRGLRYSLKSRTVLVKVFANTQS